MAIALTDLETATRIELRDEDSLTWTTAQVDAAIAAAMAEYSKHRPALQREEHTISTVNGLFDLVDAGLYSSGFDPTLRAIEFPVGLTPRAWLRFTQWGGIIAISYHRDLVTENVALWVTAVHIPDEGSDYLYAPLGDTPLIAIGAAGYAMRNQAVYDAEALTTNPNAAAALREAANEKLATFRDLIRDPRIKQGSLFRPAEEFTSQDTVQWPT